MNENAHEATGVTEAPDRRFDKRLLAYAAAAGAVVGLGQAAQAVVHTRDIDQLVVEDSFDLDVDDNGTADFTFTHSFDTGDGFSASVAGAAGTGNGIVAENLDEVPKALRLTGSSYVSGLSPLADNAVVAKEVLTEEWAGQTGYLGLAFDIDGATHYGFAHLSVGDDEVLVAVDEATDGRLLSSAPLAMLIHSVGWEDTPDTAIHISRSAASPVPEPASLTLLALGAAGLAGLGRRRTA